MKGRLLIGIAALAAGLGARAAEAGAPVAASDPRILYEGRYAADPDGSVRMGFPGVTTHLRFRGTSLSARMSASSGDVWLDVSVDGGAPARLHLRSGGGEYAIVGGGGGAEHTIELIRSGESWRGVCSVEAFLPGADGALLAPRALPPRKLMFIGDSVTCGELTAWKPGGDTKDAANSDARLSYGMILARRLGAQCHLVSYGGRGLMRDWQGVHATINAPQFYELALPDDPSARWKHGSYVPDAIAIELGQNDFSRGIPDQVDFVNAYVEFVQTIRRDAPEAFIFLMNSPMQGEGLRRSALIAFIGEVVARVGSPKVIQAYVKHYPGVPGNTHPTGAEHEAMAAELEPVIRRALGW
jgi:hypothetical protein